MKATTIAADQQTHRRAIGQPVAAHSRHEVREILRPVVSRDGDAVRWLVRQIELVRRMRLVNEAGQLLDL